MKAQILEKLMGEHLGFDLLLRLVFTRVIKVIALCLVLTLILWLFWLDNYVWGSFLLGGVLGFLVFLILRSLKHQLGCSQVEENSGAAEEVGKLTDQSEIKPKAPVKD